MCELLRALAHQPITFTHAYFRSARTEVPQSPLCANVSPDSANSSANNALDDTAPNAPHHDQLLTSLEKQLSIETKVKNGAENMIQSITSGRHGRDKKQLLAEAQQMLADAKAKIEFLKLRILKVHQTRQINKSNAQSMVSFSFVFECTDL